MTATAAGSDSHLLENVLLFGRMLHESGLPISPTQTTDFAQALALIDLGNRTHVFCAARALLAQRAEDLRLFEAIFDRFWRKLTTADEYRARKTPLAPRHEEKLAKSFTVVDYMAYKARQDDPEIEVSDRTGTYSDREVLQQKDFSTLTPEELEAMAELMHTSNWQLTQRRTHRWVADRRGQRLDLRRTLRQAARLGGTVFELPRLERKIKPRPLVLLADVSGSMERYSRVLLQFFYCMAQSLGNVESFVFGTRLSRITQALKIRNVDRALEEASAEVNDWAGGTRIGESLRQFNRHWGRRVLRRGAVAIVVSDGWERGDISTLHREMRHLQHRCHRLIWLNPLLGQAGYRPVVEGIAAALPYVDDFLPVHNLASLDRLAQHLEQLPARRGKARPPHRRLATNSTSHAASRQLH